MGRLLLENKHLSERNKFGINEILIYNPTKRIIESADVCSNNFNINSVFRFETGAIWQNQYNIINFCSDRKLSIETDEWSNDDRSTFILKSINSLTPNINCLENNVVFKIVIPGSNDYQVININGCYTFSFIPLSNQENEEICYFRELKNNISQINRINEDNTFEEIVFDEDEVKIEIKRRLSIYLINAEEFLLNKICPNKRHLVGEIVPDRQTTFGLSGLFNSILNYLDEKNENKDLNQKVLNLVLKCIVNHYDNIVIIFERKNSKYIKAIISNMYIVKEILKMAFIHDNKKEQSSLVLFNQLPHYEFFDVIVNNYLDSLFKMVTSNENFNPDLYLKLSELCQAEGNPIFLIQMKIYKKLKAAVDSNKNNKSNFDQSFKMSESGANFNNPQEASIKSMSQIQKDKVFYWLSLSSSLNLGNKHMHNKFKSKYHHNIKKICEYITDDKCDVSVTKFNIKMFTSMFISSSFNSQIVFPKVYNIYEPDDADKNIDGVINENDREYTGKLTEIYSYKIISNLK